MYVHKKNWKSFILGGMKASTLILLGKKYFQSKTLKSGLKKGDLLRVRPVLVKNKK